MEYDPPHGTNNTSCALEWYYSAQTAPADVDVHGAVRTCEAVVVGHGCTEDLVSSLCGNGVAHNNRWCTGHHAQLRRLQVAKVASESRMDDEHLPLQKRLYAHKCSIFYRERIWLAFYSRLSDRRIFLDDIDVTQGLRCWSLLPPHARRGREASQLSQVVDLHNGHVRLHFEDGWTCTAENSLDAADAAHAHRLRCVHQSMLALDVQAPVSMPKAVDTILGVEDEEGAADEAVCEVHDVAKSSGLLVASSAPSPQRVLLQSEAVAMAQQTQTVEEVVCALVHVGENRLSTWLVEWEGHSQLGYVLYTQVTSEGHIIIRMVQPAVMDEKERNMWRRLQTPGSCTVVSMRPATEFLSPLRGWDLNNVDDVVHLARTYCAKAKDYYPVHVGSDDAYDILTSLFSAKKVVPVMQAAVTYRPLPPAYQAKSAPRSVMFHSRIQQYSCETGIDFGILCSMTITTIRHINPGVALSFPPLSSDHYREKVASARAMFDNAAAEAGYVTWTSRTEAVYLSVVLRFAIKYVMSLRDRMTPHEMGSEFTEPILNFLRKKSSAEIHKQLRATGTPSVQGATDSVLTKKLALLLIMTLGARHWLVRELAANGSWVVGPRTGGQGVSP